MAQGGIFNYVDKVPPFVKNDTNHTYLFLQS